MQKIIVIEGTFPPVVIRVEEKDEKCRPVPVVLPGAFPWYMPQVGTEEARGVAE